MSDSSAEEQALARDDASAAAPLFAAIGARIGEFFRGGGGGKSKRPLHIRFLGWWKHGRLIGLVFLIAAGVVRSIDPGPVEALRLRTFDLYQNLQPRADTARPVTIVDIDDESLQAIGCFCIGTNQVDIDAAARHGVAVFNAPFSNTRSVAELTIAEVIALHRRLFERSSQMHAGSWIKTASSSHEVRGRVLGIVGYGHIGSQVSILAEAMGMRVIYFDVASKLPLGNAEPVSSHFAAIQVTLVLIGHPVGPACPHVDTDGRRLDLQVMVRGISTVPGVNGVEVLGVGCVVGHTRLRLHILVRLLTTTGENKEQ